MFAADQVKLVRAQAVERSAVSGLFHRADAAEPIGGRAEAVAVVIEERVLGRETALRIVKIGDALRRGEEDFEAQCLYTLNNPVRRGLVECWQDYPWGGVMDEWSPGCTVP